MEWEQLKIEIETILGKRLDLLQTNLEVQRSRLTETISKVQCFTEFLKQKIPNVNGIEKPIPDVESHLTRAQTARIHHKTELIKPVAADSKKIQKDIKKPEETKKKDDGKLKSEEIKVKTEEPKKKDDGKLKVEETKNKVEEAKKKDDGKLKTEEVKIKIEDTKRKDDLKVKTEEIKVKTDDTKKKEDLKLKAEEAKNKAEEAKKKKIEEAKKKKDEEDAKKKEAALKKKEEDEKKKEELKKKTEEAKEKKKQEDLEKKIKAEEAKKKADEEKERKRQEDLEKKQKSEEEKKLKSEEAKRKLEEAKEKKRQEDLEKKAKAEQDKKKPHDMKKEEIKKKIENKKAVVPSTPKHPDPSTRSPIPPTPEECSNLTDPTSEPKLDTPPTESSKTESSNPKPQDQKNPEPLKSNSPEEGKLNKNPSLLSLEEIEIQLKSLKNSYPDEELLTEKSFELSVGAKSALSLLTTMEEDKFYLDRLPKEEVIWTFRLFFIFLDKELPSNDEQAWKECQEFLSRIRDKEKNDKTIDKLIIEVISGFVFTDKNIDKIEEMIYGKDCLMQPQYYTEFCALTGLLMFAIREAAIFGGAIKGKVPIWRQYKRLLHKQQKLENELLR